MSANVASSQNNVNAIKSLMLRYATKRIEDDSNAKKAFKLLNADVSRRFKRSKNVGARKEVNAFVMIVSAFKSVNKIKRLRFRNAIAEQGDNAFVMIANAFLTVVV